MGAPAQGPSERKGTRSSRRFLTIVFSLVGLGALAASLFAVAQTRLLESNVHHLVDSMLTSMRLVGQLDDEVQTRRDLVLDHISAKDPEEMADLEAELAAVEARISRRLRGYEHWISLPGEREVWRHTLADVQKLDEPVSRALSLSRRNRDTEARRVMDEASARFALVGTDFDDLISLNDRGATASLAGFTMIRHRLVLILLGIGLAAVAGTFFLGRWTLGQIVRHEDEMKVNASRLEARNSELDAFAGRVAHDIRGGLAAIGLATTALSTKVPPDDRAMQILLRGTGRMEALVDDLLALARAEALVGGCCDPSAVVSQVVQDWAARIEEANGTLRVSVAPAEVACHEGLLRQALTNLVENAVKYRRPEVAPAVEILGAPLGNGYDLRVTDNGIGLTEDEIHRITQPFYRSPRTRDVPGTGLGLSIVNRVAEANQGSLTVDARLGQGSTFTVRLPLAPQGQPAPDRSDA
jgi:signal transduction histidine kinase